MLKVDPRISHLSVYRLLLPIAPICHYYNTIFTVIPK